MGRGVVTGDDGGFRLDGVVPPSVDLLALPKRHLAKRASIEGLVAGEERQGVMIRLSEGRAIRGGVVDEKGAPLSGAVIHVRWTGDTGGPPLSQSALMSPFHFKVATSRLDGTFEVEGVGNDRWLHIRAGAPGFDAFVRTIDARDLGHFVISLTRSKR
jgi:hypothetical protein